MSRISRISRFISAIGLAALACAAQADTARVAAAADLRYVFAELQPLFEKAQPAHKLELILGSSGKFMQQIDNGAPFDIFFSADVAFPKKLVASGKAVAPVTTYAFGRVVLWSAKVDASKLTLQDLTQDQFRKIAIAAPDHAPYGARAKEALEHAGLWAKVQPKLVFGENIAHTAQLIDTQAAEIGIVALSLAASDALKAKGGFYLIPSDYHLPLEQAYAVTRHGKDNAAAHAFARFMTTPAARQVMVKYGFVLPGETL
ncbi:molybdate ABC transporter substrate-binding protein [Rhodoferax sp.]|uniref:molybdate ABC transporter substrate-binding protein n=1 Tax=Rhodoferax sp. TaxID=50421 RepID=UPI00260DDB86|nr:molybdate ABC transporter substrate-binding protein [Rhodoferax sp.]MDD4942037.1 molybdate ABC transporter substrate-binding protein [Rhodoferax sp.]MDD5478541.1 molybdate ABC transporter substrate-binding protein [Rhodoferax sp.]